VNVVREGGVNVVPEGEGYFREGGVGPGRRGEGPVGGVKLGRGGLCLLRGGGPGP
jgi:hypothetical protein